MCCNDTLKIYYSKMCERRTHTEIESTEFHEKSGKSPSDIYICTDDMRFFCVDNLSWLIFTLFYQI